MKFKFCSEGDCPLWALAALHALGALPTALFRTLLRHVIEEQPDDGVIEILKDTSISSREECARAAAVIRWVLQQTWRCACSSVQLTRDLLVLGLPRGHAAALAEVATTMRGTHAAHARANCFTVNKVLDVELTRGPENTVDTYKLTLSANAPSTGEQRRHELFIDRSQAKTLLFELKVAYEKFTQIENDLE